MIQVKKTSLIAFIGSAILVLTSASGVACDFQTQKKFKNKDEETYSKQLSHQSSSDQKDSESMSGQSSSQDHAFSSIPSNLLGMDKSSSFYYRLLLLH